MKFANLIKTADLDSLAKLWRKLATAKIDLTPIMQSRAKLRNFKAFVDAGFPKINFTNGTVVQPTLPEGEEMTRLILGDDYLSAEEIAKAFGFEYSDAQLEQLAKTLPTDFETLLSIKAEGMLVAGPPSDTALLGVNDLDNQLFHPETGDWYSENKEKFARTDLVKAATWMIVRKTPVANSTSKNWNEQLDLIPTGNRVPNAAEMSYAIIAYLKVRDVRLFKGVQVRTASVDANDDRVCVGYYSNPDGLRVSYSWGGGRHSFLGLTCAWD